MPLVLVSEPKFIWQNGHQDRYYWFWYQTKICPWESYARFCPFLQSRSLKNWPEKALNYYNFTDFLDLKNLWNCNVMKFKTMREEKTISSLLPWGRKWFFPPSWSQISWHCNFTSFSDKRNNFFFPVGLLLCPLGNALFWTSMPM